MRRGNSKRGLYFYFILTLLTGLGLWNVVWTGLWDGLGKGVLGWNGLNGMLGLFKLTD